MILGGIRPGKQRKRCIKEASCMQMLCYSVHLFIHAVNLMTTEAVSILCTCMTHRSKLEFNHRIYRPLQLQHQQPEQVCMSM